MQNLTRKTLSLLIIIVFCFPPINGQIVINKPVLGFTEVCSSPTFNTFNLSFTFSPVANLVNGNVFNVELSDANGSFASPTLLSTSLGISSPISISFSIPTNLSGTGFKIRIKSTSPIATSLQSNVFSINYAVYNQPYTINNNIGNQSFCAGSTFTLTTDSGTNSPLNFPSLRYIWYKNNVIIPSEETSSLMVSQPGSYYSKINYGTCISNISKSNAVILSSTPAQTLSISSAENQTILCGANGIVLTSSLNSASNVYQWYKDNVVVGTNNPNYTAIIPGNYFLKIISNSCITPSNTIPIIYQNITASLNLPATNTILPGQNITIQSTTSASNPSYKWFKETTELTAEIGSSITVSDPGIYKVIIKQNTGCISEKELTTTISYPTSYSLVIKNSLGYIDCDKTSETLTTSNFTGNTTLNLLSSSIPIMYKWYRDTVEIIGQNSNSITISNFATSGNYTMKATLPNGTIVESNQIAVKLKFTENPIISSSLKFLCNANPTVTLTSSVTNSNYTYNWFKTGSTISLGTNPSFVVSIAGDYYLKVGNFGCEVTSNTVSIKKSDESLVSNQEETIVLSNNDPITITVSGADFYNWTSSFNTSENTTPNFVVNLAGTVTLTATFGSCIDVKTYTITKSTKVFSSIIPNAISPNNDGTNDTWILPEEFAYRDNVEVVIFSSKNEILYQTKNYLNDWPLKDVADKTVYFYKILKDNSEVEKGTLSVLK